MTSSIPDCSPTPEQPFGCVELWAGNERAHRHIELPGMEADLIALPSGSTKGGDLCALFSCSADTAARIVLADVVGHGYRASGVAAHIHALVHKYRDVRDTAKLLEELNDAFTLSQQAPDKPLHLTTVVTATFDRTTGEFHYAYAAHPRMLLWRSHLSGLQAIGNELEGFPLGFIAGETYGQQSLRLDPDDMILAFSDGITEVTGASGGRMDAKGLLDLARATIAPLPRPLHVHDLAEALFAAVRRYHGSDRFDDDVTLLTLRRLA